MKGMPGGMQNLVKQANQMQNKMKKLQAELEEREYDMLTEDGLIGPELRSSLADQISKLRTSLVAQPRLDLRLQKVELVRQFPLFAEMEESTRRNLARRLRTVYAAPGDVILRREEKPVQVWFIASGAVEAVTANQKQRLGRGEMFGQLAMLTRSRRRPQVTAITHCTLLALDEQRFIDLMRRNPTVHAAVLDSAARRGVYLDLPGMGVAEARHGAKKSALAKPDGAPPIPPHQDSGPLENNPKSGQR